MNTLPSFLRAATAASLVGIAVILPNWANTADSGESHLNDNANAAASGTAISSQDEVRYGRDIRPLLSESCYLCHGPDISTREADLRLDTFEEATRDLGGYAAIVPGDLEASELWYRLTTHRKGDLMPPADSNMKQLTEPQRDLIRRWIEQGAEYEPHWAFQAPERPALPGVANSAWARNQIDQFLLAGMEQAGLSPSPEASKEVLLRRVFLDLTGLPPTPEELDSFLNDSSDDAYEKWVDRLLTEEPYVSRYAERVATPWLDAARYADTNGIHMDAGRQMWAWRDWVLQALRDNMPFDQFVLEQLAGDLLPNATLSQKVASGFHRNHVITDEGGAINEEYLVEYAADRTATTGAVFMGLTLQCSRCHDHKFDPVSQEEYYSLFAYFNSIEEVGLYSQNQNVNRAFEPFLRVPDPEQDAKRLEVSDSLTSLQTEMAEPTSEDATAFAEFMAGAQQQYGVQWINTSVSDATSTTGTELTILKDSSVLASGENADKDSHTIILQTAATDMRLLMLEALQHESMFEGRVGRAPNGNAVLTSIEAEAVSLDDPNQNQKVNLTWAWADLEQDNGDFQIVNTLDGKHVLGWAVDAHNIKGGRNAMFLSDQPFGYEGGTELRVTLHYQSQYAQHSFGRVRVTPASITAAGLAALPVADSNWYGTWPYSPKEGEAGYDQVFGPEADATIDLSKKYAPDNYSWVLVPQLKENEVNNVLPAGAKVSFAGRRLFSPSERELEVSIGSDDGVQIFLDGEMVFENRVNRGAAADQDRIKLMLTPGEHTMVMKVINTGGPGGMYWKALPPVEELQDALVWSLAPQHVRDLGANDLGQRLSSIWRTQHSPVYREKLAKAEALQAQLTEIDNSIPLTMVMKERDEPRQTYLLMRGAYDLPDMDRPVDRGVPAALGGLPEGAPNNREGLARWLIDAENPLLSRVTINRMWEMIFGTGIVATPADFGLQGAWPTHPELLDWLAVEFRESGWNAKAMIKLMVTSSAYRQDSRLRDVAVAVDPGNSLLSSYPRRRLGAEEIRDQALYVSGLLVEEFGGPSVKPYQPEGLWKEVAMVQSNTRNFVRDNGDSLWRRSLYTYWKRAVPPPSLLTFDAPTREFCTTSRGTTNTPLQALVLWNDEQFVEAARVLAQRSLTETATPLLGGAALPETETRSRIRQMFRRCTGRAPDATEMPLLEDALNAFLKRYNAAPEDAAKLLTAGETMLPEGIEPATLAAWTMLGNALMALDETISHR